MKKKIVLEYTLNSSPKVIFPRLSTAGGLSEWFADNVNINGSFLSFFWEKTEQRAEVIQRKENKYVRFRWLDTEDADSQWFEFRINTDEITGDTALIITDFAEDDEKEKKRLMDEMMNFHGTLSSGVVRASSTSLLYHQNPPLPRRKNVALQDGACFPAETSLSLTKRIESFMLRGCETCPLSEWYWPLRVASSC